MKPFLALLAAALVSVVVEGALATGLGAGWVPDFSLTFVVVGALLLGPVEGMLFAFVVGLGTDMVSGALIGQHASLRLFEFAFTKLVAGQLDLRRAAPLMALVFALVLVDSLGFVALSRLFLGALPVQWFELGTLLNRAFVTALLAPLVLGRCRATADFFDESAARSEMRLDTRGPAFP